MPKSRMLGYCVSGATDYNEMSSKTTGSHQRESRRRRPEMITAEPQAAGNFTVRSCGTGARSTYKTPFPALSFTPTQQHPRTPAAPRSHLVFKGNWHVDNMIPRDLKK